MAINIKEKAKKIGKGLVTSGIIESIKFGLRRLFRQKQPQLQEKVPCLVVEKFTYLIEEFGEFTPENYGHCIMGIIDSVYPPSRNSTEIQKEVKQLREKYRLTVNREYSDAIEALEYFHKKGEEKEWFEKATKHLYQMLRHYVKFAKPLNELLLVHKPETLKRALQTIDTYYTPMKEYFNYLMCEYIQLATRSKSVYYNPHEQLDMLLPEIPSKENLAILTKITQEERVVEKL